MIKEEKEMMMVSPKAPTEPAGWLETQLPESTMKRLQEYIETAKKDPILNNSMLAGNISKSLVLKDKDDWFFQNILSILIGEFKKHYPEYTERIGILTKDAPY